MYYYIFDIKKCKKRSQVEEIKDYLGALGISGEFTYPSAAQSAEELVDLGLSKKYSTIVAIGGEEIANLVAGKLIGRKEAFGIIPLEGSDALSQLIGAANWKEACESLRYRKITEIILGQTATGHVFLTSATLLINNPVDITLEFKDYILQTRAQSLTIANFHPGIKKVGPDYLDVLITSVQSNNNKLFKKIASIFGTSKNVDGRTLSLLRARSLRIFTKTPTPLLCHDQIIAKTPQLIESTDATIRLIVAKNSPMATDN